MTLKWHFRKFQPGDALSDPDFTKALFARDADSSLARSLVRESIQNSLDARRAECPRVDVRISLHTGRWAQQSSTIALYLKGIFEHLSAEDTGLTQPPLRDEPVPFLVIEDFGTHGLRGDSRQWQPRDAKSNPFFLFFRALGRSGKADEARGRWGVGKYVFPLSSRANTVFGLTVPSDVAGPQLMGRMLLRTHSIGSNSYHPDGHWGDRDGVDGGLTLPHGDAATIDGFRTLFGLSRRGEPGLSVVVPWLKSEVTAEAIREAVIGEYFLPLLRGQLRVELWSNGSEGVIDAEAVRAFGAACNDSLLSARLALAAQICSPEAPRVIEWPQNFAWDDTAWRPEAVSPDFAQELTSQLDAGLPISIRLMTSIRLNSTHEVHYGGFSVHMLGVDGLGSSRPLIIREGITLPADATRSTVDHVALVLADHGPIASMIGDAETPAHEELQHGLIRDKYSYPKKSVTFIREAAARILGILHDSDVADDPLLLASFFPLPAAMGRPIEAPSRKRRGSDPEPPPTVPRIPPRFRLTPLAGGFKVQAVPGAADIPAELVITIAYDVRRGNPFKKYDSLDFDVRRAPIHVETTAAELAEVASNRFVVRPTGPGFALQVSGFDQHRDLKVRVIVPTTAQ